MDAVKDLLLTLQRCSKEEVGRCEGSSSDHCKVEHMLDGWVPAMMRGSALALAGVTRSRTESNELCITHHTPYFMGVIIL